MDGYLVRGLTTGNVKVGISTNVQLRFDTYRYNSSEELGIVGVREFATKTEAAEWERGVLERYRHLSIRGEWLRYAADFAASIADGSVWKERKNAPERKQKTRFVPVVVDRARLVCAVCGWEWWKRRDGKPDPKRCVNPACRSQRWRGVGKVAVEPKEHVYEPLDD